MMTLQRDAAAKCKQIRPKPDCKVTTGRGGRKAATPSLFVLKVVNNFTPDLLYSFGINSSDKREFAYYEDALLRINCDRYYKGGDWLVTPPPFLYMMGNREPRPAKLGDDGISGSGRPGAIPQL
jgi:hypothetical protein